MSKEAIRKTIPKFIGARVTRREDPNLITGKGKYVADIRLKGAAYMAVVRSPHAHARILSIDSESARSLPGILGIFTGRDVNSHFAAPLPVGVEAVTGDYLEVHNPNLFPLANGKVRYMGEPVAVVIGDDPYQLSDAVEAVAIDYDPLPAVIDLEDALAGRGAILHEEFKGNRAFIWKLAGGDVEKGFAQADAVVELSANVQRLIPNAIEPRAVSAKYEPENDQFTIWSSTQIPHLLRAELAGILGVAQERLRVIAPEVGGGFGAKGNVYPEEVLAPFLAKKMGRPICWAASRMEDYFATSHGRGQVDILRLAADREGRVLAADLKVMFDCGAYYTRALPIVPTLTGIMMTGCYDIPNVRAEVTGVFTSKVPSEAYRGAGRPEAAYLIERAMDMLARELDIDPAELRRRNFVPPESFPYRTATGLTYDSGRYAQALDHALDLADYQNLRPMQARQRQDGGKLLGVGFSAYVEICGFGPWEAGTVQVDPDGRVTILTGTSPHGQGHETSWAQIAAEVMQVPMESVTVLHGDTAIVPRGIGTFGSRSAPVGGAAVFLSAEAVVEKARKIAAHLLEAAQVDIRLIEGNFQVAGYPDRSLSWKEVAAAASEGKPELPQDLQGKLAADKDFAPEGETYPFGVHVCVVEIDPETGEIEILRYLTVDDCGRVINPLLVEGQVHGGIAQGIGQALFENTVYDENGNLVSGSLMDYALPRFHLLPGFDTNRTETPTPLNPLGVKGVGEAATVGSTPAVVNAVVDALSPLGVRHIDTPLTPEKIWRVIHGVRS
ncbi:MAG: xanthine dehydrogenase family protein molybdopterin-binding subunit [Acidobacteriota bacterium]